MPELHSGPDTDLNPSADDDSEGDVQFSETGDMTPRDDVRRFELHLGLGALPGTIAEIRREIGDRLDDHLPHLRADSHGRLELSLTIAAADLWSSVLLAMAAVVTTGYQPHWVEARPAARSARLRGAPTSARGGREEIGKR